LKNNVNKYFHGSFSPYEAAFISQHSWQESWSLLVKEDVIFGGPIFS